MRIQNLSTMVNQSDQLHFVPLFLPVAATTDNTARTSQIIDLLGYDSCTLAIVTGTLTDADATFAVTMEHGDQSNLSDTSAPASTDLVSGSSALTLAAFTFGDDNECRKIGYTGPKRYVRVTIAPSNNTGNFFVAGIAVLGNPSSIPTPNPPQ